MTTTTTRRLGALALVAALAIGACTTGGGTSAAPDTSAAPESRFYTVQKGDTLSHIAKQFYGKASQWNAIFDANRDQLDDPDRIQPGQVLRIPPQ